MGETYAKLKSFGQNQENEFSEKWNAINESIQRKERAHSPKKSKSISVLSKAQEKVPVAEKRGSLSREEEVGIFTANAMSEFEKNVKATSTKRSLHSQKIMHEAFKLISSKLHYLNPEVMVTECLEIYEENFDL